MATFCTNSWYYVPPATYTKDYVVRKPAPKVIAGKGTFVLRTQNSPTGLVVGVSGNARQRRLYVRRWLNAGYLVERLA